jgi:hypothetical protein
MLLLKDFLEKIRRSTYQPSFYCRIPDYQVLDEGITANVVKPKESYFEVRLSEMFLRDKREYWAQYIPFVIVLTEVLHDHETTEATREALPFLVTNHILGPVEKHVGDDQVVYRNTRVAGPLPYMGDDVDLFVALYGVRASDVSEKLFDFLGNVFSVMDMGGFSTYLSVARNLKDSLSSFLNIDDTKYRLGTRDSFTNRDGDPREFKECYLAYINCPEQDVNKKDFWVKDHRLHIGTKESHEPYTKYDYCLVRIDELKHRNYESLPFHKLWKQTENLILMGGHEAAEVRLQHLMHAVASSPDLTQRHRNDLQLIYKVDFDAAIEHDKKLKGIIPAELSATRGPRSGLSPKAVLQRTASIAKKAGITPAIENTLWAVSQRLDEIPHLKDRGEGFRLSGAMLNEQLDALAKITEIPDQDPEDLARAWAIEMVSTG